jgi:hypothetical protein
LASQLEEVVGDHPGNPPEIADKVISNEPLLFYFTFRLNSLYVHYFSDFIMSSSLGASFL